MGNAVTYSFKVWLSVHFIGPIALMLIGFLEPDFYFLALFVGIVLSMAALIIFALVASYINPVQIKTINKKIVLAVVGLSLTFLTLEMVGVGIEILCTYCIALTISVFIYRLSPPEKPVEETDISN